MDSKYDDDFIYGNFIGDPRPAFPIDVETLAAIQNNTSLTAVLGRIIGADKAILCGCETSGTTRQSGYVWIKSPERETTGEILYFQGGSGDTCYIHNADEDSQLVIDNVTYNGLYTRRQLKPGLNAGGRTYSWGDFTRVEDLTLAKLMAAIKQERTDRAAEVEAMKNNAQYTFVRGMIMIWSGYIREIPSGWALCDGANGTPDLRGRFVVGAGSDTTDDGVYKTKTTGNDNPRKTVKITLRAEDLPAHRHMYIGDSYAPGDDLTLIEEVSGRSGDGRGAGAKILTDSFIYDANGLSSIKQSSSTITSTAIDVRPPYYALAFIMKL